MADASVRAGMAELVEAARERNYYKGRWAESAPKPQEAAPGLWRASFQFPILPSAAERIASLCSARGWIVESASESSVVVRHPGGILEILGADAPRARSHSYNFFVGRLPALVRDEPADLRRSWTLAEAWRRMSDLRWMTPDKFIPLERDDVQVSIADDPLFEAVAFTASQPPRRGEHHGFVVALPKSPSKRPVVMGYECVETREETLEQLVEYYELPSRMEEEPVVERAGIVSLRPRAKEAPILHSADLVGHARPFLRSMFGSTGGLLDLHGEPLGRAPAVLRRLEASALADALLGPAGTACALIGESGSGRTSCAHAAAALLASQGRKERIVGLDAGRLAALGDVEAAARALREILDEAAKDPDLRLHLSGLDALFAETRLSAWNGFHLLFSPARPRPPFSFELTPAQWAKAVKDHPSLKSKAAEIQVAEPSAEDGAEMVQASAAAEGAKLDRRCARRAVELSDAADPSRPRPLRALLLVRAAAAAQRRAGSPAPIRVSESSLEAAIQGRGGAAGAPARLRSPAFRADLSARVLGQEASTSAVAKALRARALGLSRPKGPLGSFLLAGWPGTGKTETAKALADLLFGGQDALVRLDMSEFAQEFMTTRLYGSPPGYVGFERGGLLTGPLLKDPARVVLFDEIEKAHPSVLDVLLQILDDGRLTDSRGETARFDSSVVVLTSNLGAGDLAKAGLGRGVGFAPAARGVEDEKADVVEAVRGFLRPELIDRLTATCFYSRLPDDAVAQIIVRELEAFAGRMEEMSGVRASWAPEVPAFVAAGRGAVEGARGAIRRLEALLHDLLADEAFEGASGSSWRLCVEDGALRAKVSPEGPSEEPPPERTVPIQSGSLDSSSGERDPWLQPPPSGEG